MPTSSKKLMGGGMGFVLLVGSGILLDPAALAFSGVAFASSASAKKSKALQNQPLPKVEVKTSLGAFVVEINTAKAPLTSKQFLNLVSSGFYKSKVFHRVIPRFMVQGGGLDLKLVNQALADSESGQKRGIARLKNESHNGLKNMRGTVALARSQDPDSGTAQFFVNLVDNPSLDPLVAKGNVLQKAGFAVFGSVVQGMDILDKMGEVYTIPLGPFSDVPKTPIVIDDARIVN